MYDFSKVNYAAAYCVNFALSSQCDPNQKIHVEVPVQINEDEITFSAWGYAPEDPLQRLLLRSHFCLSGANLEDVASSIVEMLMDSRRFHKNVESLAAECEFDDFTINEDEGINIIVYPLIRFACPKELAPAYLHGNWADELILEVIFSFTEEGNCEYNLYAHVSISETRVLLASGGFHLNCQECPETACPHKNGEPFGSEDTEHFAENILSGELSNHADEIQGLLLQCEEELLDGMELPRSLKIGVIGKGKNTVFIAPDGLSEEDAESVQALQNFFAGLTDEEDDEC